MKNPKKLEEFRKEREAVEEVCRLVTDFFNNNDIKAAEWMRSKNHLFGNQSPLQLISVGKAYKLLKIVKQQLAENGSSHD